MVRVPKLSRKKQPVFLDNEGDNEEDDWASDMKMYLGQQLVSYLIKKKLKPEDQELMKDIVQKYQEKLDNNVYVKHT